MSLAWGSLVLVIVLLPGILFFVGTYLPEQFTREAEPRSPLGHLAGAVLIAFTLHGALYVASGSLCGGSLPCISIRGLLEVASFDASVTGNAANIDAMLSHYRLWIFGYVMTTSFLGVLVGYGYGKLSSERKIRGLSRHPWVHGLKVEGLTYAYVLTHVKHEDRVLMYRGFLRAFGLQQDGRFSYIVLTDVTRFYMRLGDDASVTSSIDTHKVIGASTPGEVAGRTVASPPRRSAESLFVIEGEDVANVVFDVLETDAKAVSRDELRKIVREEAQSIGLVLSDDEVEEILRAAP